jgi:hypothetical protein
MAHNTHLPETFAAFYATPADETKEFSRPGGFKGKAVAPFYLVKRLTERFGLCGKGWMVKHYNTETVCAQNGTVAVYVLLSLLYKEKGDTEWSEVGPHYGGDVAIEVKKPEKQTKNLDGSYNMLSVDDEAYKKAYTDAFSKCCSWIGLGGDVHDGMTDGNKYLATKPWDVSIEESVAKGRATREPVAQTSPANVAQESPQGQVIDAEVLPPQPTDGWTLENQETFSVLLYTDLFLLFKNAGNEGAFTDEAEKWKGRKAKDGPEKVLPGLQKRIKTLTDAASAAKKAEPANPTPSPEAGKMASATPSKTQDRSTDDYSTPEYETKAKAALKVAMDRFKDQFIKTGLPEADAKIKALAIRNEVLAKINYGTEANASRKIMILAEAVSNHANALKIP